MKIPEELSTRKIWLLWAELKRGDDSTKIPIAPWITGTYHTPINAHDQNNWTTYEEAEQYQRDANVQSVGLAFEICDGIVGIDLDDCIDADGKISDFASDLVKKTDTYVEISPSGTGLHILGLGRKRKALIHTGTSQKIEIYSENRFFTFTGKGFKEGRTELTNIDDLLDELYSQYEKGEVDIDQLLQGVKEGERNDAGIKIATWYRRKGLDKKDALNKLMDWNAKNDPPLNLQEIGHIVDSAYRRDEPYGWRYTPPPDGGKKSKRAGELAVHLLNKHKFITADDTETVYRYDDGIYRDDGESIIKTEVEELVGDETTNYLVNEVIGHIKRVNRVKREEFNKWNALPVKNGVIDLEDGFKYRKFDPEEIYTYRLDIEYDPEADCPKIKEFINQVVDGEDRLTIQEYIGYCLYPKMPSQVSLWLYGSGANGKTTLANLIRMFVGRENNAGVMLSDLAPDRRFDLIDFYGKMVNIVSEPTTRKELETSRFKQLTGGDEIKGEIKGKQKKIKFVNYAKFIIVANDLPQVKDDTHAFWRRLIMIGFPHKFEGNDAVKNLAEKLWSDEKERSGMLNYALAGLKRLMNNNWEFTINKKMEEMKLEYRRLSDSCRSFIEERCEVKGGEVIPKDEVYQQYVRYCEEEGLIKKDIRALTGKIKELRGVEEMLKRMDGIPKRCWVNLAIKDTDENKKAGLRCNDRNDRNDFFLLENK